MEEALGAGGHGFLEQHDALIGLVADELQGGEAAGRHHVEMLPAARGHDKAFCCGHCDVLPGGRVTRRQTYGRTRSPKSLIASMILSCGGPPEWAWRSRSKNVLASVAFRQRWNSRMQVSGSPRIRRSGARVSSVNSDPADRLRNSARRFSQ